MSYKVTQARQVIETAGAQRLTGDSAGYYLNRLAEAELKSLAAVQDVDDVWMRQQLDPREREQLQSLASRAADMLLRQQRIAAQDAAQQAEQQQRDAERNAAAEADKAAFVARVRAAHTGTDADVEQTANALWRKHVAAETAAQMDATMTEARRIVGGLI